MHRSRDSITIHGRRYSPSLSSSTPRTQRARAHWLQGPPPAISHCMLAVCLPPHVPSLRNAGAESLVGSARCAHGGCFCRPSLSLLSLSLLLASHVRRLHSRGSKASQVAPPLEHLGRRIAPDCRSWTALCLPSVIHCRQPTTTSEVTSLARYTRRIEQDGLARSVSRVADRPGRRRVSVQGVWRGRTPRLVARAVADAGLDS